ncbi:MAG: hypothetical protein IIC41_04260 [Candidatus Marinimicrobia bacterium]|nr:hypothetical protein [Candidatus Neomarinimicrobiota bacterium]
MSIRVFHTRLSHFVIHAERLVDPSLATRPVAVITSAAQNGTILDLSAEAVQEGLATGMRVSLARKVSRTAVLLPFHASLYQKVQGVLFQRLVRFSPAVEPVGYGSFFLDMSGMGGLYHSLVQAGRLLARDLAHQVDLAPRVGIGRNKLVSAIATKVLFDGPVLEVPAGEEMDFLAPLRSITLPVAREKPVLRTFADLNLLIVRDVQQLLGSRQLGVVAFGAFSRRVTAQCRGIDTALVRPTQLGAGADRIVERYVMPEDTNDEGQLQAAAQLLADTVGHQLRRLGRIAGKVVLQVHYTDGYEQRATGRLDRSDTFTVSRELVRLYRRANRRRGRVRSLTVDAGRLRPFADQLPLFGHTGNEKQERLSHALDRLQQRFGNGVVLPLSAAHLAA